MACSAQSDAERCACQCQLPALPASPLLRRQHPQPSRCHAALRVPRPRAMVRTFSPVNPPLRPLNRRPRQDNGDRRRELLCGNMWSGVDCGPKPMRLTIAGGSHTFLFHVVGEVAEAEYAYPQGAVSPRLSVAGRYTGLSMEHPSDGTSPPRVADASDPPRERAPSPEGSGAPPPRRGPSVELDPTGIVTGKSADRQRRQFLNYSFYRLDPVFRRLPPDDQRAAAAEFIELVRKWESVDDLILRTYSLVGLRADVDFMLWRIAFDPLCIQSMEAAIRRSRLGRTSPSHTTFSRCSAVRRTSTR